MYNSTKKTYVIVKDKNGKKIAEFGPFGNEGLASQKVTDGTLPISRHTSANPTSLSYVLESRMAIEKKPEETEDTDSEG